MLQNPNKTKYSVVLVSNAGAGVTVSGIQEAWRVTSPWITPEELIKQTQ